MKLRSISNARRIAWYGGSNISAQKKQKAVSTAPNTNGENPSAPLDARRNEPERKKIFQVWQSPKNLLKIAQTTASMTLAFHLRRWPRSTRNMLDGMVGDAAAHCLAQYYATSEFDQPTTEEDFRAFCYKESIKFMAQEMKQYHTEHGGDDAIRKTMERQDNDGDPLEWLTTCSSAEQQTHLEAIEAVDVFSELPPRFKQMASKMAGGANVLECSKEMGLSLPDAINMQKAVRFLIVAFEEIEH